MAETMALSKILHVREQEKNDAHKAYRNSMELFEEIATKLYTLLRKKEAAEESYESYLQQTTPIDQLKEQVRYIEILNKQIVTLQHSVQQARNEMETNQEKLTSAHVEVKKFEKIIELRQKEQAENIQKQEKQLMDQISIQQFLSRKNG
ncbi:flagellar export protein FliJ [Virgibacillus sp. FSP13]